MLFVLMVMVLLMLMLVLVLVLVVLMLPLVLVPALALYTGRMCCPSDAGGHQWCCWLLLWRAVVERKWVGGFDNC